MVGSVLRHLREARGITQAELGRRLGVRRRWAHDREVGRAPTGAMELARALDALDATPDERRRAWSALGVPLADLAPGSTGARSLSELLRCAREASGLTREQLSSAIGELVSDPPPVAVIAAWEGERSRELLLGWSPSELRVLDLVLALRVCGADHLIGEASVLLAGELLDGPSELQLASK